MATCLILPFAIAQLFNPAAALAQSTAFPSSDSQMRFERFSDRDAAIPNSLTRAQLDTESYLAAPVSSFAVRCNELMQASELFKTIDVTVFFDRNVEGVFDGDTEVSMRSGVSMAKSLSNALRERDTEFVIESDGSILLISIDDENEPDFLRTVTYDVTYIASTQSKADRLAQVLFNTINSDSWEQNGGGNGTLSLYQINGRILMSVNQSQRAHRAIRNHFDAIVWLGSKKSNGSRPITLDNEPIANRSRSNSLSSSVVELPQQQTTSSLRSRRGFARPNSGTSGGMGGRGFKGGGMF